MLHVLTGRVLVSLGLVAVVVLVVGLAAAQLTVVFDKTVYDIDDTVSFTVSGLAVGDTIGIEVRSVSGQLVWVHEATANSTSETFSFRLPGLDEEGYYTLYVSVEGSVPEAFSFRVAKPLFSIVDAPSVLRGSAGGSVSATISISNSGAGGTVEVRVLWDTQVVASKQVYVGGESTATTTISWSLPSTPGTYVYTIQLYNVKYDKVDDEASVTVIAEAPTTTVTATPTPTPTPTPTETVTTPATTTTTPIVTTTAPAVPGGVVTYVADLTPVTTEEGEAVTDIVVVVPEPHVKIHIPAGTKIVVDGKPVRKLYVTVLAEPPESPPTQVPVGPAVDMAPSGAVFTKPVTIEMEFDPAKIPAGYVVRLAYYAEGEWKPVITAVVDFTRRVVVGQTTHFTVFAPVAFTAAPPPQPVTVTETVTVPVTETVVETVTETVQEKVTETVTETVVTERVETVTETVATPTTVVTERTVTKTTPSPTTITATKEVPRTVERTVVQTVTTEKEVVREVVPVWVYIVIVVLLAAIGVVYFIARRATR